MDPLCVLGSAAVAQFIATAHRSSSRAARYSNPAKGATADNLALENVVSTLLALSEKLSSPIKSPPPGRPSVKPASSQMQIAKSLAQLSAQCEADCKELLGILQKLEVDGTSKHCLWKSVKAGLGTVWESRKIRDFEKRLKQAQDSMLVYLVDFVSDEISGLSRKVSQMKQENARMQLDQSAKLDSISQGLKELNLDMEVSDDGNTPIILQRITAADVIDKLASRLDNLFSGHFHLSKQQAVLTSLNFQSRPVRHEAISDAHTRTFCWIFTSALSDWLQTGSGIFWISGRAGSGKSTLMKFLADTPDTDEALAKWASPKPVAVVTHYFWSAGTPMQRSQQGLLQTLLFEIFRKCPDCIPIACSSRWSNAESKLADVRLEAWSTLEIRTALEVLASHHDLPAKFCFFVDGLDEFDGEHVGLCDILDEFSRSPNFKLCIASRPLNAFEDAFRSCARLSIHGFTQDDIAAFAKDRLQSHPRWAACAAEEGEKESLIRTIGDRANGVFLWVLLVTDSLLRGLTNDDDIDELQQRLGILPTRLESLFKHMLDSVDVVYHEKMAGNFLLALQADAPLSLEIFGYQDHEYKDKNYANHWPVRIASASETKKLQSRTRRRINERAQGLLEVRSGSVEFLHRTVRDFLRTKEMNEYLLHKTAEHFDAALSITRAFVVKIKSTDFSNGGADTASGEKVSRPVVRNSPGDNGGLLIDLSKACLNHASGVSEHGLEQLSDLLEELERAVEVMFNVGQARFFMGHCHPWLPVRETVLRSRCHEYVAYKLRTSADDYFSIFVASKPPLGSAKLITMLLDRGWDPNEEDNASGELTPWLAFVSRISPWSRPYSGQDLFRFAVKDRLFSEFLSHGADPNARHPASRLTAFAMYLLAVFSLSLTYDMYAAYLVTLDDFLNAGADLLAEIPAIDSRRLDCSLDLEKPAGQESTMTILSAFCLFLREKYSSFPPNLMDLIASVAEKLFARARFDSEARSELEVTFAAIKAPEFQKILDSYHSGRSAKRPLEESDEMQGVVKKQFSLRK